ncbi:MAG: hypothetical protein QNK23_10930 [Crocinitomicaceae bacterium]|nr:hypothetical protein [Crocinitomicaceae bacterium]
MKKLILILPIFLLFIACSEDSTTDTAATEEVVPLTEREPEVKSYLDSVTTTVKKYVALAEYFFEAEQKMESGELGTMETLGMIVKLGETAIEINELYTAFSDAEASKTNVIENLSADDLVEFTQLYVEATKGLEEYAEKIGASSYYTLNFLAGSDEE